MALEEYVAQKSLLGLCRAINLTKSSDGNNRPKDSEKSEFGARVT
jgi:hypothetical protein